MKRLLTLATTSMFVTGLAILPVGAFAQPNATTGADVKANGSSHIVTSDTKTPVAKDNLATKDTAKSGVVTKDVSKDSVATKDAGKTTSQKLSSAPSSAAPSGSAKTTTGNHDKGA